MEKVDICKICKINIAKYNCKLCGKHVCSDCYSNGLCLNCRMGKS